MDTRNLEYFVAIAEERNMTKAAERLYVAQSSLSYQLNKLEEDVGVPLFLRTKNDMILTPAGNLYLDTALKVIALKDRLYQNIAALNQRGYLRIAITSIWGNKIMENVLPGFKKAFPELIFEVNHVYDQAQLKNEIIKGKLDFALISVPFLESSDDRTELLGVEELLFAVPVSHPYVSDNPGPTITHKELVDNFFDETILASKKSSPNYLLLEQLFKVNKGAVPPKVCGVSGLALTCSIVAQEAGVALIPVSGRGSDDKIHYYSCNPQIFRYNVMMHRDNLVFNRPEQGFFDCVKRYYQDNIGPVVTTPLG